MLIKATLHSKREKPHELQVVSGLCLSVELFVRLIKNAVGLFSDTFFAHPDPEALLQTTVLALVPVMLVNLAFSVRSARVKTQS